jgi:hypothetical protein
MKLSPAHINLVLSHVSAGGSPLIDFFYNSLIFLKLKRVAQDVFKPNLLLKGDSRPWI